MNPADATPRRTTAVLTIILSSYFMILLDNSIVFTALPTIDRALQLTPTGLAWAQDAYTLVFGGLLLLGDSGHRRQPGTAPAVLAARVDAALATSGALLALGLITALALILPNDLAQRRRMAASAPALPVAATR